MLDLRNRWDDPAEAHADEPVPAWLRWYHGSKFRWRCEACGARQFMVMPHSPEPGQDEQ